MSIEWWRSWHGAPMDHKWSVIAARTGVKAGIVSAIAWALFDYASQNKERGSIRGFDVEEYSVYSGFDEAVINSVIQAMTDKGIITDGRLTAWTKRQPQREDNSTERVREWREMKRNETQCNAKKSPDKDTDTDKYMGADAPSEEPVDPKTIAAAFGVPPHGIKPLPEWVPEDCRKLAKAFSDSTGIPFPSRKSDKAFWISTWRSQNTKGLQPEHITRAVSKMHGLSMLIKSPESVDAFAVDEMVNPQSSGPAAAVEM